MAYISPKLGALYSLINSCEEAFARASDVLINVSDDLQLSFKKKPIECVTIMNCPNELILERPKATVFTVIFSGHVRKHRCLEVLLDVVRQLEDIQLLISGEIIDKELFYQILSTQNVKYCGLLPLDQLLFLEQSAHAVVALYNLEIPLNRFAMPNKLFEAMMCGLQIITNVAKELIIETNSGIMVEYDNEQQLKSALVTLRDDALLRERLGNNGRSAFYKKYNWKIMEDRLYRIYYDIIR
jgi:glycosyltransferase involved in cell wall biosynthesis